MKPGIIIILTCFVTLAAGCDPARGIRRHVALAQLPSDAAVAEALQRLPDTDIERRHDTDTTYFNLRRRDAAGVVILHTRAKAPALTLCLLRIGRPPSENELTASRTLLDDAYHQLRVSFPDLPPPTKF